MLWTLLLSIYSLLYCYVHIHLSSTQVKLSLGISKLRPWKTTTERVILWVDPCFWTIKIIKHDQWIKHHSHNIVRFSHPIQIVFDNISIFQVISITSISTYQKSFSVSVFISISTLKRDETDNWSKTGLNVKASSQIYPHSPSIVSTNTTPEPYY